jgi:phosphohistidine phosphatase
LEIDAPLVETDGLLPIDDPRIMARRLAEYPAVHDIALVGHEPHLSALATLLVTGKVRPIAFHCKKSSVMCLRDTNDDHSNSGLPRWRVAWHFSPELLTDE